MGTLTNKTNNNKKMETNAKIKPLNKQDNEEFKQETLEEVAERYGKQVLDERKSKNLLIDEEIWLSGGSIVGFIDGAKCQEDMANTSKVTRFEVIDENGRVYQKWNCKVELSYQDDGRTLKVFIKPLDKQD